jgi:glycosyltransferase involved in cell wall biosynthesis
MQQSKIAYISFDTVPAPKGAAIHITAFACALAAVFGDIQLVTVSPTAFSKNAEEIYPQVKQTMLPAVGKNLIERVLYYRNFLHTWLQKQRFEVVQIRSIYEGLVIAINKQQYCDKLIFEVNGLPSIELKYRYPAVADDQELLHKLQAQEQICLTAADLIITPSSVTANYLQSQGIPVNKIRVIPNGVNLDVFTYQIPTQKNFDILEMLYFGTLSPWQGVNLAVEALELINQNFPANLTVIGQGRDYQVQALKKIADKLGVTDKLTILAPISQTELVAYIHKSDVILAPLTPNDRNLVQGCCPLKILEGMATGIPIIASDLPVVRELGTDAVDFLLVKSGSAKAIKEAVLRLINDQKLAKQITTNARKRIEENYTWEIAGTALIAAYNELEIKRSITT